MRPCYAFSNIAAADNKPAVLSIYDEIGLWGVQAKDFVEQLGKVQGQNLDLEINSPGGDVFAALAMYNALRASGKTITAKVMGVAASAASIVFMAGDKRVMPKNTHLMVHNPWTIAAGNSDELRDTADTLDKIGASLQATYAARSGMSDEDVKAMLSKDTWLSADEAKGKGLATEVVDEVKATAKFDMERADLPENVRAVFASTAKPATPPAPAASAPAPTPAPAPAAEPETPFAEQVGVLAKDAGFEAHAARWAIACKTTDEVKARIGVAREVKALCALAKVDPKKADEFIASGKDIAAVRTEVQTLLAAADPVIDTSRRSGGGDGADTSKAIDSKSVYAKRAEARAASANPESKKAATSGSSVYAKRKQQTTGA